MTTRIISDQILNLPVDTIYYIAGSDENLNSFIAANSDKISLLVNAEKERYFDFHFQYISLQTLSDQSFRELISFQLPGISGQALDNIINQSRSRLGTFRHDGDYNLLARILPANNDDFRLLSAQISSDGTLGQISEFVSKLARKNKLFHTEVKAASDEILYNDDSLPKRRSRKVTQGTESPLMGFQSCRAIESIPAPSESDEAYAIACRIRDEILELQKKNSINILTGILGKDTIQLLKTLGEIPKISPSPLVITESFDITLPKYSQTIQTIQMKALPKTIYFLFLIYPEGIILKELYKYESTLMEIYKLVSNRENSITMGLSIKDLINPESNSINEKLSRIRIAFNEKLPQDIAQEYIPYGLRGEKKHIALDKTKITLPESLLKLRK